MLPIWTNNYSTRVDTLLTNPNNKLQLHDIHARNVFFPVSHVSLQSSLGIAKRTDLYDRPVENEMNSRNHVAA